MSDRYGDILLNTLLYGGNLRCVVATTTHLVQEAVRRHQTDPVASIALGRSLGCSQVLASNLKTEVGIVSCEFDGDGPLQKVVSECNGAGECRGYVGVPQVAAVLSEGEKVPQSVGAALGMRGHLTISQVDRKGAGPYTGICELASGEIAADVAYYLSRSVQTPSAVAAGVKLDKDGEVLGAGAVLVQKMGGGHITEEQLRDIERKLYQDLRLSERIVSGDSVDEIFEYLTGIEPSTIFLTKRPIKFHCGCERDRMKRYLKQLGQEELQTIYDEVGKIEVRCQYCGDEHRFALEEF